MLKKIVLSIISLGVTTLSFAQLNINTATADELDKQLNGIGPAKAKAIVEYREKNGAFKSVDDLASVPGIKMATVNKLREQATVGNVAATPVTTKAQPITKPK